MPSPKSILTVIALVTALAMCPACGESDQASSKVRLLRFSDWPIAGKQSYRYSNISLRNDYGVDKSFNFFSHVKPGDVKTLTLLSGKPYNYVEIKTVLSAFFFQSSGAEGIAGMANSICREAYAIAKKHQQAKQLDLEVWFREQGPLDADIQRIMEKLFRDRSKKLGYITFRKLDQARQCASADEYSAKMGKLVRANIRVAFNGLRVFKDY